MSDQKLGYGKWIRCQGTSRKLEFKVRNQKDGGFFLLSPSYFLDLQGHSSRPLLPTISSHRVQVFLSIPIATDPQEHFLSFLRTIIALSIFILFPPDLEYSSELPYIRNFKIKLYAMVFLHIGCTDKQDIPQSQRIFGMF